MTPSNIFDEKYFTSVNYTNYLSRYERYERLAAEIGTLMGNLSLLNKDSKCLDYGCAVGFLPKAFQKKGYPNFYGYDISDWAKSEARKNNVPILENINNIDFDVTFCLDVMEHMSDACINDWLDNFKTRSMVVRTPVAPRSGEDFHLSVSRKDPTHINCKTKDDWKGLLKKYGFDVFLHLHLFTIYDTEGVFSCLCLKSKDFK
ncbi:MAG TPA: class I SAM-dependent methyltransferase [Nitrospina sp.]|nr:class I SAM-dependent methyltransferase [Nitrospina sp.]